jgi:hypothetical protein
VKLAIVQQGEVYPSASGLFDGPDQAAQIAKTSIADDEHIDVTIRSPRTGRPRAIDRGSVYIGAVKRRAQLALDTHRAMQ